MFDFLWPSSYKRWAYPKISPVTCEWWRYIFILIISGGKSITLKPTYAYAWSTNFEILVLLLFLISISEMSALISSKLHN